MPNGLRNAALLLVALTATLLPPPTHGAEPEGSEVAGPPLLELLRGEVDEDDHPGLVRSGHGHLLKSVAERLEGLLACARDPDCGGGRVKMRVCSRFRSLGHQRNSWLKHMRKRQNAIPDSTERVQSILMYLALPGTSRHHWGTDVDLTEDRGCTLSNHPYMTAEENEHHCARARDRCMQLRVAPRAAECSAKVATSGGDEDVARRCERKLRRYEAVCQGKYKYCYKREGRSVDWYRWMQRNAPKYGFCQPYKGYPESRNGGLFTRGYEPERWHWSSCCEAKKLLDAYRANMDRLKPDFEDVFGRGVLSQRVRDKYEKTYDEFVLDAYKQHVLNIHPDCIACAQDCD